MMTNWKKGFELKKSINKMICGYVVLTKLARHVMIYDFTYRNVHILN